MNLADTSHASPSPNGCGSHPGQIFRNLIEQAVEVLANAGGAMAKMVIEVPEQFVDVGKAMAEQLAMLQRTADRLIGGKAVDYAAVETAIAEGACKTELAAHGAMLKSLDIDVPAVVIGGVRYTQVGRCEGAYHTMAGSLSVERSLYRNRERAGDSLRPRWWMP